MYRGVGLGIVLVTCGEILERDELNLLPVSGCILRAAAVRLGTVSLYVVECLYG